jgi:TolA-binding protein
MGLLVLLFSCVVGSAQTPIPTKPAEISQSPKGPATDLIQATQQYKTSSQELLTLQQNQIREAEAKLEELRTLVSEGLVAKAELEESEQTLIAFRAQVEATQKRIADSDGMMAEIQAEQALAKAQAAKPMKLVSTQSAGLNTKATILRYSGASAWSLNGLSEVQTFFATKFGHMLPTSAVGQSATHNRLGWDHRNAVDVAVHPDSTEGRTLISYLQQQGIPFLAFRGAIPGVATGPHIHIGSPSHRLS